jgi:hypothetical protein
MALIRHCERSGNTGAVIPARSLAGLVDVRVAKSRHCRVTVRLEVTVKGGSIAVPEVLGQDHVLVKVSVALNGGL